MTNFAKDIEQAAEGEEIIGIVVGPFGWGSWGEEGYLEDEVVRVKIPWEKRGVVLTWQEARPLLDYDYGDGFGAPECHAIVAWTENRVIFVGQYDGATSVYSLPRHPSPCRPYMPGR